jgi:hypothetical protein
MNIPNRPYSKSTIKFHKNEDAMRCRCDKARQYWKMQFSQPWRCGPTQVWPKSEKESSAYSNVCKWIISKSRAEKMSTEKVEQEIRDMSRYMFFHTRRDRAPTRIHVPFGHMIVFSSWMVHAGCAGIKGRSGQRMHLYSSFHEDDVVEDATNPVGFVNNKASEVFDELFAK